MTFLKTIIEDAKRYRHCGRFEFFEPSLWVIINYRLGHAIRSIKPNFVKNIISLIHMPFYMFLSLITGIYIPRGAQIGPGLRIWHFGGIIFNPDTVMGSNCTIRHGVTIGNRNDLHDVPVIGNNVEIGAGAILIGSIKIGDNSTIGAGAIVLRDVPANHIAVGNPAKVFLKAG